MDSAQVKYPPDFQTRQGRLGRNRPDAAASYLADPLNVLMTKAMKER